MKRIVPRGTDPNDVWHGLASVSLPAMDETTTLIDYTAVRLNHTAGKLLRLGIGYALNWSYSFGSGVYSLPQQHRNNAINTIVNGCLQQPQSPLWRGDRVYIEGPGIVVGHELGNKQIKCSLGQGALIGVVSGITFDRIHPSLVGLDPVHEIDGRLGLLLTRSRICTGEHPTTFPAQYTVLSVPLDADVRISRIVEQEPDRATAGAVIY